LWYKAETNAVAEIARKVDRIKKQLIYAVEKMCLSNINNINNLSCLAILPFWQNSVGEIFDRMEILFSQVLFYAISFRNRSAIVR